MRKGFTLVELLVVIAIIGLIASIVLVNLQGTRQRGRVAAGKQFSSQLQNTLGLEAVGIWRFNEGSGTTAYDNSGYGNNGSLTNSPAWKTEEECGLGLGTCLEFDGTDDYVTVPDSSSLTTTSAITLSIWVNIDSVGSDWTYIIQKGTRWRIETRVTGELYWTLETEGGGQVWYTSSSWTVGNWHHLVASYDSLTGKMSFYKDGVRVGETDHTFGGNIAVSSDPVRFGGNITGSRMVNGMIDDVYIFASGLTTAQVQQLYVQGLKNHQIASQ